METIIILSKENEGKKTVQRSHFLRTLNKDQCLKNQLYLMGIKNWVMEVQ